MTIIFFHFVFLFKIVSICLMRAILTDLSPEAFNSISHDLLIAKLNAYEFNKNTLNAIIIFSSLRFCIRSSPLQYKFMTYQLCRRYHSLRMR